MVKKNKFGGGGGWGVASLPDSFTGKPGYEAGGGGGGMVCVEYISELFCFPCCTLASEIL